MEAPLEDNTTEISIPDKFGLTHKEQSDFFNVLLSSGISLDVMDKNQWRTRKYIFSPPSSALEARKNGDPLGQLVSSITIRDARVNSVTNDPNRFVLVTRNKQYLCRVATPRLRRQWMCWIETMCMESSLLTAHLERAEPNPKVRPRWWVPHEEADRCAACSQGFTVTKWRHTCRQCGFIFCGRGCFVETHKCCESCLPFAKQSNTSSTPVATPAQSRRPSLALTMSTPSFSIAVGTPSTPSAGASAGWTTPLASPSSTYAAEDDSMSLTPPDTPARTHTTPSTPTRADAPTPSTPTATIVAPVTPIVAPTLAAPAPTPTPASSATPAADAFAREFSPEILAPELVRLPSPAELLAALPHARADAAAPTSVPTASASTSPRAGGAARRQQLEGMRAKESRVDVWFVCVVCLCALGWYLCDAVW